MNEKNHEKLFNFILVTCVIDNINTAILICVFTHFCNRDMYKSQKEGS